MCMTRLSLLSRGFLKNYDHHSTWQHQVLKNCGFRNGVDMSSTWLLVFSSKKLEEPGSKGENSYAELCEMK